MSCYENLRNSEEFKGFTDERLEKFIGEIDELSRTLGPTKDFEKAVNALVGDMQLQAKNMELRKKIQAVKAKQNKQLVARFEDPFKAVEAIMAGSSSYREGAGRGIYLDAKARSSSLIKMIDDQVDALGKDAAFAFKTGQLGKNVWIEVARIENPKGGYAPTGDAAAEAAAKIVAKMNQKIKRMYETSLGHKLGSVEEYITKQSHDSFRLTNAGLEKWMNDIMPLIDFEETFGTAAMDKRSVEKRLSEIFGEITSGNRKQDATKTRAIVFKGPEERFTYNSNYGRGELYDNLIEAVMDAGKKTALMDRLGPDYQKGFNDLVGYVKDAKPEKGVGIEKYNDGIAKQSAGVRQLTALYNQLTGSVYAPAGTVGDVVTGMRVFNDITLLGGVAIRSATGNIAQAVQNQLIYDGFEKFLPRFAERLGKQVLEFATMFGEQGGDVGRFGLALQDMQAARWGEMDMSRPGLLAHGMAKAFDWAGNKTKYEPFGELARIARQKGAAQATRQAFFRATAVEALQSATAEVTAAVRARELGSLAGTAFGDLPANMKVNFQRMGIDAFDWDLIQLGMSDAGNGKVFSINEFLAATPDKVIKELAKKHEKKIGRTLASGNLPENYRDGTVRKLQSMVLEEIQRAQSSPGLFVQAVGTGGASAGSLQGAVSRLVTQYKSFGLEQMRQINMINNVAAAITGIKTDGKALQTPFTARGAAYIGASSMALMTSFYLGEQLIRMSQGKPVESLAEPKNVASYMMRSGVFGIMGDFAMSTTQHDQFEAIASATAGPSVYRSIKGVGLLAANANYQYAQVYPAMGVRGPRNPERETAAFVQQLIPLQNWTLIRPFYQPFIIDPILSQVSDKYVWNRELRKMQEGL